METAAVILIVTAVTAYLIRRAIRNHKGGDMCSNCSGSCPYSDQCPSMKED